MKNINERFVEAMAFVGVSGYAISKEMGISEATITNIRKGKTKPSSDILEWILKKYEVISADYIMRGEGSLQRSPVEKELHIVAMQIGEMYQEFKGTNSLQSSKMITVSKPVSKPVSITKRKE